MRVLKAGVLYFALVFVPGFVFGSVRILCIVRISSKRNGLVGGNADHACDHHCLGADPRLESIANYHGAWLISLLV